ncbi:MAG TPA: DEDD exonuclease domain-containing protein [Actinomycetota bacterium]|nr:DEDD exonuclease domain-containing protein [Actinomycetota bacterium]
MPAASVAIQGRLDDLGTPLLDVEFVVLDLETTGGSPAHDRITEVGAVKIRGGEVLGTFHTLVNPEVPIPPLISALTGITNPMVADAEPIEVVLPCLLEFLGGAVLVAHNASFDRRFVQANLERHGYQRIPNRVVCTARLARKLLPRDEVPNVRLATLAAYLGATVTPCHRALTDAQATVDVFHSLLERAGSYGVLALEDLIEFPSARAGASFKKVHLADRLPHCPGVYLFRDAAGRVLYVGKAKDLRTRVRSYFSGDGRVKVADLLRELAAIDHQPCATELEASVREVRLIQHHRPRYNRRSRNPERYCYLKLTRERFPRLSLVRRVLPDGARYLGPFPSAGQAELVKAAIEDALPLRRCTMRLGARGGGSACALLELGRCLGPCTGAVAEERYAALVATLETALDGDPEPVLGPLRRRMAGYAADQRYEQAAGARDRLEALTRALAEARRAAALATADEIVLARPHPEGREVTVVRRGQLAAVALLPAADAPAAGSPAAEGPVAGDPALDGDPGLRRLLAGAAAAEVFDGPPPRHLVDEVNLVTRWLEGAAGKAELLWVRGRLASPAVGGALLQVRYDPGRHRHAWPPGEARGRPEARPSRRPARRHAGLVRWP